MKDALNWLGSNGLDIDGEDGMPSFDKIGTVPITQRSQEDRDSDLDDALNWLRGRGNNFDDPSGIFKKLDSMLPSGLAGQSENERAKDMENALNWLRHNGVDLNSLETILVDVTVD
jgi:hypothetical protein